MKVQGNGIQPFQSSTVAAGLGAKTFKAIGENPILATTDVLDIGIGSSVALNSFTGQTGEFMQGAGVVLGGYHVLKAGYHLLQGVGMIDTTEDEQRNSWTKAVGDGLSAVGMFTAANGIGPVSLAFVGLGGLVTNARTLTE